MHKGPSEQEVADHDPNCRLETAATLTGWPTPQVMDDMASHNLAERRKKGGCSNLKDVVPEILTGWPTPNTMQGGQTSRGGRSVRQAAGGTLGSPAPTGPRGVLNPDFPRWLMGYPEAWATCAPGYREWTLVQSCVARAATGEEPSPATATP
jgi:hypothetical protein